MIDIKLQFNSILKAVVMLLLVILTDSFVYAQEYLHLNSENNLRFEKRNYKNKSIHSNIKPFILSDSINYNNPTSKSYSNIQKKWANKILNDDLFEISTGSFSAYINPIITIAPNFEIGSKKSFDNNQFGLSIGANVEQKLAFQFNGFYGIQSFPLPIERLIDSVEIIPGYGKYYSKKGENYHYFDIRGYLSYSPWKYLNLQAGIGKNFWGDGYRSLFLSDNANSYPFVKATVDVWKFKYIWMFGALKDYNSDYLDVSFKNKLLFSHYLSWNATKWLSLNFFESIISNPVDSTGVSYFNVNYLNPVIFFRPVEFAGGSADNAILGFGVKLKLWKKYQLYGQFVIDEFVLSEVSSNNGWWGNKYGIQVGLKLFDLLNLKNLFGRIEYNRIQPYTYSYSNSIVNYGNYYQPLAHPSGANLEELVLQLHYHINRYSFEAKAVFCEKGMDSGEISYGGNVYKSYDLRLEDYGNALKQGFKGSFSDILLKTSWLVNPKTNLSMYFILNYKNYYQPDGNFKHTYISLGIKTIIGDQSLDFIR